MTGVGGRRVTTVRKKVYEGENIVRLVSEKGGGGSGYEGGVGRKGEGGFGGVENGEEGEGEGGKVAEVGMGESVRNISTDTQTVEKKYARRYTPCVEDNEWASKGLIGTVLNGESIPLIQNRVEDAGFKDVNIIPLGEDKVFVHSLSDVSVIDIVGKAKQFFNLIFSSMSIWKKGVLPFHRGAWLRVYGIPLHAWNENFFKLCVMDRGRYLRTDLAR